ncbi:hypothetical protein F511_41288 [Dorcoceras hygrometricum]|uniref:Transmembrane protein n=1 Tax=Dorcoceras hygrometricum TaxID=472368 RepID=A0A2Z7AUC8_9LAMI|nr:hypothetical protein F511_41288 [Dorcoceras hygrometricum]
MVGGAELVSLSSFDCYQLGDLSRRVEGARRIYMLFVLRFYLVFLFLFCVLGSVLPNAGVAEMPPRRGRGRTARHTAEESRASESDEDVQQNIPLRRRERQAEWRM